MDPQQELFTALLTAIQTLGYDVYDGYLPPKGTPYPFVYVGEVQQVDEANKSAVFGKVHATVHVWHNTPKQRGTVSQMLLNIKTACRNLRYTQGFSWDVRNIDQRILPDDTTETPLLHGVLDVEFQFS